MGSWFSFSVRSASPLVLVASLTLGLYPRAAVAQCAGSNNIFSVGLPGTSPASGICSAAGVLCKKPILTAGPVYRLEDPACNPRTAVGGCVVQASVQCEFPGNEDNGSGVTPWIFWFNRPDVPAGCVPGFPIPAACTNVAAICGLPGQLVLDDFEDTWIRFGGVTCDNARTILDVYAVGAFVCPVSGSSCRQLTEVENIELGGTAMATDIGCPPPPCKKCPCQLGAGGGVGADGGRVTLPSSNSSIMT